jgi:hypothetical protein
MPESVAIFIEWRSARMGSSVGKSNQANGFENAARPGREKDGETVSRTTVNIPPSFTKQRTVEWWGQKHEVQPLLCDAILGNGRLLLAVQMLNTRPDYYLIRIDSKWSKKMDLDEFYDHMSDEIIETLIDQFSEKEREREYLEDDLRAQGIEPTGDNTDLNGNEDRLGWPVLSLDSGYAWWIKATLKRGKWTE